jgi:hypothetical protein
VSPSESTSPSVLAFSVGVWRDVRHTLNRLFLLALVTFPIVLALEVMDDWILPSTDHLLASELRRLAFEAVEAFFALPYIIAVHRFIILGETTARYRLAVASPVFQRFFLLSLAVLLFDNAPAIAEAMLPDWKTGWSLIGRVAAAISLPLILAISLPLIVLFPAVAADGPDAGWRLVVAAWGHWWRIFFINVMVMAPLVLIVALPVVFLRGDDDAGIVVTVLNAITFLGFATAGAVTASRIYQWIGAGNP